VTYHVKKIYIKANRKTPGHLLDEMEAYANLHRKSLIRLLRTEIHVGSLLGYERLDTAAQTSLLSTICQKVWIYFNFLQPLRKLVVKETIPAKDG
jgi:hypothetical protein